MTTTQAITERICRTFTPKRKAKKSFFESVVQEEIKKISTRHKSSSNQITRKMYEDAGFKANSIVSLIVQKQLIAASNGGL